MRAATSPTSSLGNGGETIRTQDLENGRNTAIRSIHGQQRAQDLTFEFDAGGNLARRADARQGYTKTAVYSPQPVVEVVTQTGVKGTGMGNQPLGMRRGTKTTVAVTCNLLGNTISKTDIGAHGYGENLSACPDVIGAVAAASRVSSKAGTVNPILNSVDEGRYSHHTSLLRKMCTFREMLFSWHFRMQALDCCGTCRGAIVIGFYWGRKGR